MDDEVEGLRFRLQGLGSAPAALPPDGSAFSPDGSPFSPDGGETVSPDGRPWITRRGGGQAGRRAERSIQRKLRGSRSQGGEDHFADKIKIIRSSEHDFFVMVAP